jgi:hypothetical protein
MIIEEILQKMLTFDFNFKCKQTRQALKLPVEKGKILSALSLNFPSKKACKNTQKKHNN